MSESAWLRPEAAVEMDVVDDSPRHQRRLLKQASFANLVIVLLMCVAYPAPEFGYGLAVAFLLLLCVQAFRAPKETMFLIFGIKLTLDLLWWVVPPESMSVPLRITHLSFAPIALSLAVQFHRERIQLNAPLLAGLLFVAWCGLVPFYNPGIQPNIEVITRVSGSFIGLMIGVLFLASRGDLETIVKLALLSTVVPLLAALIQVFATFLEMPIFFYTVGGTRGARYAGLNHDSGGLGLVALVGMLNAIYLLYSNAVATHRQKYLYAWIGLSFFLLSAGATRSVFMTAGLAIAAFLVVRFRKAVKLIPFLIAALWFAYPYIERMSQKSLKEVRGSGISVNTSFEELFTDRRYNRLLTGRMQLWQMIYRTHDSASLPQQLFGTGIRTNAHSSYFFLLLYIGKLGLLSFIVFNFILLRTIYRSGVDSDLRWLAVIGLLMFMLMGLSLTTVLYTSFQWMLYLLLGGVIRIAQQKQLMRSAMTPYYHE